MTAEVVLPPLTVHEAGRALSAAFDRVRMHKHGYDRLRRGKDILVITRARTDWGLAVLEWIEASVALAEAEDRRDPVWAGTARHRQQALKVADPSRSQCDRSWSDYQEARRTGDQAAVTVARAAWRDACVTWFQGLAAQRATEDQQHAQELRHRLDDSERLDPEDAFPSPPSSLAEELVRAGKERARQESIRRDTMRGLGWRPVGR
jgi:hypothetical protein